MFGHLEAECLEGVRKDWQRKGKAHDVETTTIIAKSQPAANKIGQEDALGQEDVAFAKRADNTRHLDNPLPVVLFDLIVIKHDSTLDDNG